VTTTTTLAILMPVYNEAGTVEQAIERLRSTAPPEGVMRRIVCVDDGSTDGSADLLRSLEARHEDIKLLKHPRNLGKGAALRTAIEHARESADVLLIHDADMEYDPADHARVLEPILEGRADAVVGSRFRGGTTHRVLYYWHSIANRVVTHFSNAFTNLNLSDIECCFKAFTHEVAKQIQIEEPGFGVEPELVAKVARVRIDGRSARIYEVPVTYAGRTYEEGKKIGASDGLWALWCIVKYGLGSHDSSVASAGEAPEEPVSQDGRAEAPAQQQATTGA